MKYDGIDPSCTSGRQSKVYSILAYYEEVQNNINITQKK